ncbi:MAG TPA: Calx-beta domain-containing protein, partial [Vicinamibacteria bacterium]
MKSSLFKLIPILAWALLPAAAFADGPGVLKLDEESFEVSEDAGVAVIRVERSQGEDGAVSVQYGTSNGTAVAGQDYTAVSGTLSWASGDGSDRTFTVPILDDAAAEGSETFQIALSGATGGAAIDSERGTTTVWILANDGGSGGGGGNGGDDDPDDD